MIDQYAEEVKVWKECWVKWDGDEDVVEEKKVVVEVKRDEEKAEEEAEKGRKMPGAYQW